MHDIFCIRYAERNALWGLSCSQICMSLLVSERVDMFERILKLLILFRSIREIRGKCRFEKKLSYGSKFWASYWILLGGTSSIFIWFNSHFCAKMSVIVQTVFQQAIRLVCRFVNGIFILVPHSIILLIPWKSLLAQNVITWLMWDTSVSYPCMKNL